MKQKREFTIRPSEWPAENLEWELVFTTEIGPGSSTSNIERVSLEYMKDMQAQIGNFLDSECAKHTPHREPRKLTGHDA